MLHVVLQTSGLSFDRLSFDKKARRPKKVVLIQSRRCSSSQEVHQHQNEITPAAKKAVIRRLTLHQTEQADSCRLGHEQHELLQTGSCNCYYQGPLNMRHFLSKIFLPINAHISVFAFFLLLNGTSGNQTQVRRVAPLWGTLERTLLRLLQNP